MRTKCAELRRVLLPKPGMELDESDENEPEDKFSSPKRAVVDRKAVEKSPAGLRMDR